MSHRKLRPFQKIGVDFALKRKRSVNADEPGLGKTIQAIELFNRLEWVERCLVLCPGHLKLNWKREFRRWTRREHPVRIVSGRAQCQNVRKKEVVIINPDIVASHYNWLSDVVWDLLVVDEAHYYKSPRSLRTKLLFGGKAKKVQYRGIKAKHHLYLTGTPIMNRPIDLWPLVRAIDPRGLGESFYKFVMRYCPPRFTRWGPVYKRGTNLDELGQRLSGYMIRRLKTDVLAELPKKRRQIIELTSTGSIRSLLNTELTQYQTYKDYAGKPDGGSRVAFTELTKVRKQVALLKIPQVIEHLRLCIEEGSATVCFTYHVEVAERIASAFPKECFLVTGKTSQPERDDSIRRFQAGKGMIFVATMKALGTGCTLTRASRVVFAELDWTPSVITQAEDRCHRIGQESSVLVQHLVLEKSLDLKIAKIVVHKQRMIGRILNEAQE